MTRREVAALVGAAVVLIVVGGPAAVASYLHAWDVAERSGSHAVAAWLPLTTDGMLVAALVVMWVRRFIAEPIGRGPWAAFALGLAATLAANIAGAVLAPTIAERFLVAVWPPVAFAVTLELLALLVGHLRGGPARTGGNRPDRSAADRTGIAVGPPIGDPDATDELGSDRVVDDLPVERIGRIESVDAADRWDDPIPELADPALELTDDDYAPDGPADRTPEDWGTEDAVRLAQSGRLLEDPRLTPADLLIVEKIEAELAAGGSLPSIRQTRLTHGLGKGRADRILNAVRLPEGSTR